MNENRGLFVLDGITGMLIATVLLLSILVGLTAWGLSAQQANAANYYEIKDATSIKMIDKTSGSHKVDVK
jgi:succinate dehydrogenase/fumarate reductase cytochrome b subunit